MTRVVKESYRIEMRQLCCSAVPVVFDNAEKSPIGINAVSLLFACDWFWM